MTVKLSAIAEIAVNHCTVEDKCTVSSIEQEEQERKKKKKTMQETERERERERERGDEKDAKAQIRRRPVV